MQTSKGYRKNLSQLTCTAIGRKDSCCPSERLLTFTCVEKDYRTERK